jgi:hypothetical protein
MAGNLIAVFARGNKELFHSAFLAWLLKESSPHQLGEAVLEGLLSRLGLYVANQDYTIRTEVCDRGCRFDILIESREPGPLKKGLVIENKTKSLGDHRQLDRYRDEGYEVAALALLPQILDDRTQAEYPVIQYRHIRDLVADALAKCRCDSNPYQFFIQEYVRHLTHELGVFDALSRYCHGDGSLDYLTTWMSEASDVVVTESDVRTLNYCYYSELEKYLRENRPELVFGTGTIEEYLAGGQNTRWICEKNVQGPPYVEALVWDFSSSATRFRLDDTLREIHAEKAFTLAPRIQVRLDPQHLSNGADESTEVGEMLLGSWADGPNKPKHEPLWELFRDKEPYKSQLARKPRARTNVHAETITLGAIRFAAVADRLKSLMEKVGRFE